MHWWWSDIKIKVVYCHELHFAQYLRIREQLLMFIVSKRTILSFVVTEMSHDLHICKHRTKNTATILHLFLFSILQALVLQNGNFIHFPGPHMFNLMSGCLGPFTEASESTDDWCRVTNGPIFLSALGQVRLVCSIDDGWFSTEVRNGLQNNNGLQKGRVWFTRRLKGNLLVSLKGFAAPHSFPLTHCPIHSTFSTPLCRSH